MADYLIFEGVQAPVEIEGANGLCDLVREVMPGWPIRVLSEPPAAAPFFKVAPSDKPGCYIATDIGQGTGPRRLNALNAVCDIIAALPLALAASHDDLVCLHAAAVQMGDGLVVFPNTRRAGKSLLSAALARAGYDVFSDDVLALSFTGDGQGIGRASGVSIRLRLPLPDAAGKGFGDWVKANPGPRNAQYKYLTLPQPAFGTRARVRSFVILDRQEGEDAALCPVSPDEAMAALLHQNFTRDRHSGDVLSAMARLLQRETIFRLTYSDPGEAVACLEAMFGAGQGAAEEIPGPVTTFRMANLSGTVPGLPEGAGRLGQVEGATPAMLGDVLYLADADGRGIHRMDPLSAVIWDLIAEPTPPEELARLLVDAFTDVDPAQIRRDVAFLCQRLVKACLASVVSEADTDSTDAKAQIA